jgi:dihydrodipicolinate synthase/N-acetylneuraminate lyase
MREAWSDLLGTVADVPYPVWATSIVVLAVGCDGALSSFSGSVPGIVTALVTLAQAYRVKAKAKAAQDESEARVQAALAQAYSDKAADLVQAREMASEALTTAQRAQASADECEQREAEARTAAAQRELDLERQLEQIRAEARASVMPRPA